MTNSFIRFLRYRIKGSTEEMNPDIDEVRSVFPSNVADGGGMQNFSASTYIDSIISPISTRYFILEGVALKNAEVRNHNIVLYDGVSASVGKATALGFQIAGSTNEFITGLKWPFHSGVYAHVPTSITNSAGIGLQIRLQGILIASHT